MQLSEKIFVAPSGNTCRCLFETKDERIGVSALWAAKPSDADTREAMTFVLRELQSEGLEAGSIISSAQGAGVAGKARSIAAVRRFLKTGDPGVETTDFEPAAGKDRP